MLKQQPFEFGIRAFRQIRSRKKEEEGRSRKEREGRSRKEREGRSRKEREGRSTKVDEWTSPAQEKGGEFWHLCIMSFVFKICFLQCFLGNYAIVGAYGNDDNGTYSYTQNNYAYTHYTILVSSKTCTSQRTHNSQHTYAC